MSEIPFVNRLGDALEAAIAAPAPRPARARRRRPPRLVVALAALLTLGGGVALAGLLSDPTELATNGVACSATPDLDAGVSVVWAGDRSPAEACAQVLRDGGRRVPALATCDTGRGGVAVLPGRGPGACERAGLAPLPAGYSAERARVAALQRAVLALESSADCVPPRELAARVRALLRASGWTGWGTTLRLDTRRGPCGRVSGPGGTGVRTISGALDADARRVVVSAGPHRSTEDLLHARGGIAAALMDASGERCHTPAGIRVLARRRLAPAGRRVRFTVSRPPAGVGLDEPRGRRLADGCAVVTSVSPDADGLGVVVEMWQR